jgi:hypothetical protein
MSLGCGLRLSLLGRAAKRTVFDYSPPIAVAVMAIQPCLEFHTSRTIKAATVLWTNTWLHWEPPPRSYSPDETFVQSLRHRFDQSSGRERKIMKRTGFSRENMTHLLPGPIGMPFSGKSRSYMRLLWKCCPTRLSQNNHIGSGHHAAGVITPANPGSESGADPGVQEISESLDSGSLRNSGKAVGFTRRNIYVWTTPTWRGSALG